MRPPVDPAVVADLNAAQDVGLGPLLLQAARLLDERAIARINAAPGRPARVTVRPSHTRLFPHLSFEGVRITELARRLGVTKQAVQPLVAELQDQGVVETVPDPTDGRARLVRFTPFGAQAMAHGLGVLAELEREVVEDLGEARVEALRDLLRGLIARWHLPG